MNKVIKTLLLYIFLFPSFLLQAAPNMMIDFTKKLDCLTVVTDATERAQGLSNATINFQNSQHNKSHYFYAHLEPQTK